MNKDIFLSVLIYMSNNKLPPIIPRSFYKFNPNQNSNLSTNINNPSKNGVTLSPSSVYLPPDPCSAAANGYCMCVWNLQYQIYNVDSFTYNLTQYNNNSPTNIITIFSNIRINRTISLTTNNLSDPYIVYNTFLNKFVLIIFYNISSSRTAGILIAVSKDNTPINGWNTYYFTSYNNYNKKSIVFPDYPKIGFNASNTYISINSFNLAGTIYLGPVLYNIPNTILNISYTNTTDIFNHLDFQVLSLSTNYFSVFPLQKFDNNTGMYFVSAPYVSSTTALYVHYTSTGNISNRKTGTSNLSIKSITVKKYSFPVNVPQPLVSGKTIYNLDCLGNRISTGVVKNNIIWTSHTIKDPSSLNIFSTSLDCVRWYGISISSLTSFSLKASGNIQYHPTLNQNAGIFMSAIGTDGTNVVLCFNVSGSLSTGNIDVYPSIGYYTFPTTITGFTKTPISQLAYRGNSSYSSTITNPIRWGDYASICVYSDNKVFFATNESVRQTTPLSNSSWDIQIATIQINGGIII